MDAPVSRELGLFPLGLVALPGERIPLHIFEPRYRALVADCALGAEPFVITLATEEGVAATGCAVRLHGLIRRFADGRMNIVVVGDERVAIDAQTAGRPYLTARVAGVEDVQDTVPDAGAERAVREAFRRLAETVAGAAAEAEDEVGVPLSYAVAGSLDLEPPVKQALLEERSENARLARVREILDAALAGLDRQAIAEARAHTNGKVTLE